MLQEFADESDNQDLKMNKSKTKVMMKNDTPLCQQHLDRERRKLHLPGTEIDNQRQKTKKRRFKEESRPDGQHSPCSTISSMLTLEHA